jgi:hypothetical protein
MNDKLDTSIEQAVGRFQVRPRNRIESSGAAAGTQASPVSQKAPAGQGAAQALPNQDEASSATSPAAAAANPATDNPKSSSPDGTHMPQAEEGADLAQPQREITAWLPKEIFSTRFAKQIITAVEKWTPPESLSKREVSTFRQGACLARTTSALDSALKWHLGHVLLDARNRLARGAFTPYLTDACDLPRNTAYRYIAVAEAFADPRTVNLLGFETCYAITRMKLPQEILDRLVTVTSHTEADAIIRTYEESVTILNAWNGILPSAETDLGRELALELAQPPFVAGLRKLVAQNVPAVKDLVEKYRAAFAEYADGDAAVRAISGQGENTQPQAAGRVQVKNLVLRVEALKQYAGKATSPAIESLPAEIETKLLELERLLENTVDSIERH